MRRATANAPREVWRTRERRAGGPPPRGPAGLLPRSTPFGTYRLGVSEAVVDALPARMFPPRCMGVRAEAFVGWETRPATRPRFRVRVMVPAATVCEEPYAR